MATVDFEFAAGDMETQDAQVNKLLEEAGVRRNELRRQMRGIEAGLKLVEEWHAQTELAIKLAYDISRQSEELKYCDTSARGKAKKEHLEKTIARQSEELQETKPKRAELAGKIKSAAAKRKELVQELVAKHEQEMRDTLAKALE